MAIRLRPILPPAPDALLVGDPRRAFVTAQEVLEQPRMSHQARGLWGYTGTTPQGAALTVQSTGSGAPSAVAVLSGLATLGVKRVLRVGTAAGLDPELRAGQALLVDRALAQDGLGGRLCPEGQAAHPGPAMRARLEGLGRPATVVSRDLEAEVEHRLLGPAGPPPDGADASDLQSAALLAAAPTLAVRAAVMLVVAETAEGRLDDDSFERRAAEVAARAAPAAFTVGG